MRKKPFLLRRFVQLNVFVCVLLMLSCNSNSQVMPINNDANYGKTYPLMPDGEIKNIIFFIGDGMGIAQITAGRIYKYGANGRLHVERMPVAGIVHTNSSDNLITDSAAGATALASGVKTKNGMIGMNPDSVAMTTILELAQTAGKSTGLVATSSITHATPACFASHVDYRKKEPEIADQLVQSGVDVLLGAGKSFFVPKDSAESRREDERNLLVEAQQAGYSVVQTREALAAINSGKVLGLFADVSLKNERPEPTLKELTEKSLELLSKNNKGFFLMVEGSQIDWGAHDNDQEYTVREMLSFDEAVEAGIQFAMKDKHTLVVVTADHETGGMTIEGGSFTGGELKTDWTTGGHTGVPVPIFAFGPNAAKFSGVYDNTAIPQIFAKIWKFSDFPGVKK